jgi:hypothetical protein
MKFRGLIIAVVVLLVLGGLLYWSNHRKPAPESAAAASAASPPILKVDQGAIEQVTLTRKDAAPVSLDKQGSGNWRITEPKAFNADSDAVSGMLSSISSLNADRVVEDKASDLKQYGLDQPSLQVQIETKDHTQDDLLFGDETPTGGDVYAMLQGNPKVFTVASYNKTSIDKGVNDLRDKRLVTIAPDKVSRVDLHKAGQEIEFARIKDGWQILKPEPSRADSFAVDEFVRTVADAKMDLTGNEADHAATDFAQGSPLAAVTLTGDQGPQTLTLRKSKQDYFAQSTAVDGAYQVDTSLGTALDKSLDQFRNKKLFDFGYEDPNKIELHEGAKSWFLTRSGNDWWSNGKKMDSSSVESLVESLRGLAATSFPTAGFSSADVEATVTSSNGKRTEKVLISKSGSNYVAKRENEPELYQLDASAVSAVTNAADAIKPASAPAKK